MLTEELSPKMTLEVASGLFELYLTLADIQRFWSSIPGRCVPCPRLSPSLQTPQSVSVHYLPPRPVPTTPCPSTRLSSSLL